MSAAPWVVVLVEELWAPVHQDAVVAVVVDVGVVVGVVGVGDGLQRSKINGELFDQEG